jgi:hypothetical protein
MTGSLSRILILIFSGILICFSCSQYSDEIKKDKTSESVIAEYPKAVINVNIADIKKEPRKHAERVSQALYNEIVDVLETNDNYARIRQRDGYEGWIRSYYLANDFNLTGSDSFIVDAYLAPAYEKPDRKSKRKTMFPYGCRLIGDVDKNFLRVESPRYGVIFVDSSDLLRENVGFFMVEPDSAGICREAGKFMGAPYLWGGKSFYGIDCSGLTQIVMRRFGVDLPRDSRDQMTRGIEVDRDNVRAGDLLFFPNHVGLAATKDLMIHSTGYNGGVAYNSLDPESPIYSEYHAENFIMARRIVSQGVAD